MHTEHRGLLYALLSALAGATCAVFIKLASNVQFETLVFFRFFLAFLLICPTLYLQKVEIRFKLVPKHFLRALMGLASIYCYFYSVTKLPLVTAVTLTNTTPLFMPLVIFFWLKLIIPKWRVIGLLIGFIGVVLILRPSSGFLDWVSCVGLLGACASAFALVGVRQLSKTESTATIMAYYFLIAISILFIPMVVTWKPIDDPMNWIYLLLIGITSTLYQYCLTKSLTHAPLTKVGSLTFLSVIFSGLFGWAFFSEVPSLWIVEGVTLVIIGGVLTLSCKESARKRGS